MANPTLNRFTAVLGLMLLGSACSGADSTDWGVVPGTYNVSRPVCESTLKAPVYPAPEYQAAMLDFDALTSHQLVVPIRSSDPIEEIFTDADCALTLERSVAKNRAAQFSVRSNRRYTFVPDGCGLSIVFQGQRIELDRSTSGAFTDRPDEFKEEIPYDVTAEGEAIILTSRDLPLVNDLWQKYGCSQLDSIKWQLNRLYN